MTKLQERQLQEQQRPRKPAPATPSVQTFLSPLTQDHASKRPAAALDARIARVPRPRLTASHESLCFIVGMGMGPRMTAVLFAWRTGRPCFFLHTVLSLACTQHTQTNTHISYQKVATCPALPETEQTSFNCRAAHPATAKPATASDRRSILGSPSSADLRCFTRHEQALLILSQLWSDVSCVFSKGNLPFS